MTPRRTPAESSLAATPSAFPAPGTADTHAEGGPRPGHWLAVVVTDSDPGIPRDQIGAIFDEFARLAPDVAPGAGLGLAIAPRIARLLGGDITVDSEAGRGSAFTLWLPADRPEERQVRPPTGVHATA